MIAWAKEKKIEINVNVRPGPICFLGSLDSYFWRRDDIRSNPLETLGQHIVPAVKWKPDSRNRRETY